MIPDHLLGLPAHDGSVRYVPEPTPTLGSTVPVLLRVPGVGARAAENVYGGAAMLCGQGGSVQLPADGPAIQIWRRR